jgi:ankyrin repeat protein
MELESTIRSASDFQVGVGVHDLRSHYSESDVMEISGLLRHQNLRWSVVPRTYIVLRRIGSLHLLDQLLDAGFNDLWFPVTKDLLPQFLDSGTKARFVEVQQIVLTNANDFRCGERRHYSIFTGDSLPFTHREPLNSGTSGSVDKVVDRASGQEYARKRILRKKFFERPKDETKAFESELRILRRLKHRHTVGLMFSYSDPDYHGLLISPLADGNLNDFLWNGEAAAYHHPAKIQLLRGSFGCLATGLAYLHEQQIKHKDIKPSNILVKGMTVLFADFGISHDWTGDSQSTTEGPTALTQRYAPIEVADWRCRNSSSDIWSLGCVYLEILSVLKGKTRSELDNFFVNKETGCFRYRDDVRLIRNWLNSLEDSPSSREDNVCLSWILMMLQHDANLRLNAQQVAGYITQLCDRPRSGIMFCSACCLPVDMTEGVELKSHRLRSKSNCIPAGDTESSITMSNKRKNEDPNIPGNGDMKVENSVQQPKKLRNLDKSVQTESDPPLSMGIKRSAILDEMNFLAARKRFDSSASSSPSAGSGEILTYANGRDPNHVQVKSGNSSEDVKMFLQAAIDGDDDLLRNLLRRGVDIEAQDEHGRTALQLGVENGHLAVVQALIVRFDDTKFETLEQDTVVHYAAQVGNKELMQLLLKSAFRKALKIHGSEGLTPIGTASKQGHEDIVWLILAAMLDGAERNEAYDEALRAAALARHEVLVHQLLQKGANHDRSIYDSSPPPLYFAAEEGRLVITRFLVERGALVNENRRYPPETPIIAATRNGHSHVMKYLMSVGADLNPELDSCFGSEKTVLFYAAKRGMQDVVKLLLDRGADSSISGGPLANALRGATDGAQCEMVRFLLQLGADINEGIGSMEGTALHRASENENKSMMEFLLSMGADINATTTRGTTPLHIVLRAKSMDIVNFLLKQGARVDIEQDGWNGATVFHSLLAYKSERDYVREDWIRLLIDNGASITAKDKDGNTVMHAVAEEGRANIIPFLVANGCDINAANHSGETPLKVAATNDHLDDKKFQIARVLLQYGADVNAADESGWTPLHGAAQCSYIGGGDKAVPKLVRLLIEEGASINAKANDGTTPLHLAACHNPTFRFLISKGADIHAKSDELGTPLCVLVSETFRDEDDEADELTDTYSKERLAMVKGLLDMRADVNFRGGEFGSPIMAAVRTTFDPLGDKLVRLLIERGADWKSEIGELGNAFHTACYGKSSGVIHRFLEAGANINASGGKYGYPLQAAAVRGILRNVSLLLSRGAKVNDRGGEYGTALHAACANDREDVVRLLLRKGAEFEGSDSKGRTALQVAVINGALKCIPVLLEHGADPNKVDDSIPTEVPETDKSSVQAAIEMVKDGAKREELRTW